MAGVERVKDQSWRRALEICLKARDSARPLTYLELRSCFAVPMKASNRLDGLTSDDIRLMYSAVDERRRYFFDQTSKREAIADEYAKYDSPAHLPIAALMAGVLIGNVQVLIALAGTNQLLKNIAIAMLLVANIYFTYAFITSLVSAQIMRFTGRRAKECELFLFWMEKASVYMKSDIVAQQSVKNLDQEWQEEVWHSDPDPKERRR
jgi:hypothetical protein